MSQENISSKQPLIRYVNRQQMSWRAVDVERLVGDDHLARAIWTLVGRLDLGGFYQGIESSAEEGGRPAFDPQLLISLWVYAYSQGIGSAREVARRCEYDPAFQWLTGTQEVNYHTLADFRVEKQKELDELFTQVLAALSKEGLITLEQVMQDGTKIKALASTRSYQREGTIQGHLERARQRVAEMGDPRNEETSPKAKQAQARARREQQERLESALEELQKLQARKSGEKAKSETRVSTSDPQARVMKQSDGGLALSYNAQISTDAAHGLIVGVAVTQEANDSAQLLPAVDRLEQRLKKKPQQMVADGGYTTRDNIEKMAGREIDFLGAWDERRRRVGRPLRIAFRRARSSINRRRIAMFVRKASCCGHRDDIPSQTGAGRSLISTRLNSVTANVVTASPNAARKIRATVAACSVCRRLLQWLTFREKMAGAEAHNNIAAAEESWNFATRGSKASWACGSSTCGLGESAERDALGLPHLQPAALDPLEEASHRATVS